LLGEFGGFDEQGEQLQLSMGKRYKAALIFHKNTFTFTKINAGFSSG
jgi:hypothetical protein